MYVSCNFLIDLNGIVPCCEGPCIILQEKHALSIIAASQIRKLNCEKKIIEI